MSPSFFQSTLWRSLQGIFGRRLLSDTLVDDEVWGVSRVRNLVGFSLSWDQFLGVRGGASVLAHFMAQRNVCRGRMYTQLGVDEILWRGEAQSYSKDVVADVLRLRTEYESLMLGEGFLSSRRENMPLATIVTPCLPEEEQVSLMHASHRRYLRKGIKTGLVFVEASPAQWEGFYAVWQGLARGKGLGIMSYQHFVAMMQYLTETQQGQLFLALKDGEIVSGSVCCFRTGVLGDGRDSPHLVYLYGATDRAWGNVGGHIYLQHAIMQRGFVQGYRFFDHRGVAPLGRDHHLAGVTQFKERFGGERIEFAGNYDWVEHRLLYRLMQKLS